MKRGTKKILGIELGSTRIKSVLIDERGNVLASGSHEWKSELVGGHWSYSLSEAGNGVRASYAALVKDYGEPIVRLDALGVSAMMHGYLAFDKEWNLLASFRTWKDVTTAEAARILSEELDFNVPERWSAAHYYQAILRGEPHVGSVARLTTLSGYVHRMLTDRNVLGANDASGMFPLKNGDYDENRLKKFNALAGTDFRRLLPKVLLAGENAGTLTEAGAKFLDASGTLRAGAVCCPPEGDMGTGMVCARAIEPTTAQASLGTSANFSVVLEKPLNGRYEQIDLMCTPDGKDCALVHANNCACELNEWMRLFSEVARVFGTEVSKDESYAKLFEKSAESDCGAGGVISYNFLGGETAVGAADGVPMIIRESDGKLTLANLMKSLLYSTVAPLSIGAEALGKENVRVTKITAHGGLYRTKGVAQRLTAAALNAPVTLGKNASEGGAFGIALLAGYALGKSGSLSEYLSAFFPEEEAGETVYSTEEEREEYLRYLGKYKKYLGAEFAAAKIHAGSDEK